MNDKRYIRGVLSLMFSDNQSSMAEIGLMYIICGHYPNAVFNLSMVTNLVLNDEKKVLKILNSLTSRGGLVKEENENLWYLNPNIPIDPNIV